MFLKNTRCTYYLLHYLPLKISISQCAFLSMNTEWPVPSRLQIYFNSLFVVCSPTGRQVLPSTFSLYYYCDKSTFFFHNVNSSLKLFPSFQSQTRRCNSPFNLNPHFDLIRLLFSTSSVEFQPRKKLLLKSNFPPRLYHEFQCSKL